jgi:hypothetical protein
MDIFLKTLGNIASKPVKSSLIVVFAVVYGLVAKEAATNPKNRVAREATIGMSSGIAGAVIKGVADKVIDRTVDRAAESSYRSIIASYKREFIAAQRRLHTLQQQDRLAWDLWLTPGGGGAQNFFNGLDPAEQERLRGVGREMKQLQNTMYTCRELFFSEVARRHRAWYRR